MARMRFYTKSNITQAVQIRKHMVSTLLPPQCQEQELRVFCKQPDEAAMKAVKEAFASWCVANNCQRPLDANMEFLATPRKGSGGRGGERGGGGGAGGSGGGGAKSKQSIPFTLPEEC